MNDEGPPIDWRKTTFDGSRREQLRRAKAMTVRQRLEALEQLAELAERMRSMPREAAIAGASTDVCEEPAGHYADRRRSSGKAEFQRRPRRPL